MAACTSTVSISAKEKQSNDFDRRRRLNGTMNGGGAKVNMSTTNGGVRLSKIGNKTSKTGLGRPKPVAVQIPSITVLKETHTSGAYEFPRKTAIFGGIIRALLRSAVSINYSKRTNSLC